MGRATWNEYFIDIARLVGSRSTCLRRHVGAIAVKDRRILATGYNGVPTGMAHCADTGCLRRKMDVASGERHELCRGLHAEQNVIIQAAVHGINLAGAELYCTHHPCVVCAKMLINCQISHIYYLDNYADSLASDMLSEAHIPCTAV